jgi:hypothetical protein
MKKMGTATEGLVQHKFCVSGRTVRHELQHILFYPTAPKDQQYYNLSENKQ